MRPIREELLQLRQGHRQIPLALYHRKRDPARTRETGPEETARAEVRRARIRDHLLRGHRQFRQVRLLLQEGGHGPRLHHPGARQRPARGGGQPLLERRILLPGHRKQEFLALGRRQARLQGGADRRLLRRARILPLRRIESGQPQRDGRPGLRRCETGPESTDPQGQAGNRPVRVLHGKSLENRRPRMEGCLRGGSAQPPARSRPPVSERDGPHPGVQAGGGRALRRVQQTEPRQGPLRLRTPGAHRRHALPLRQGRQRGPHRVLCVLPGPGEIPGQGDGESLLADHRSR